MKYYRPESLEELFAVLTGLRQSDYRILAGGTDLIPFYQQQALPAVMIDIKKLGKLTGISITPEQVEIGALTTVAELEEHALVRSEYQALWQAAGEFGGVQIRNRATLGGNICNASPAGDLLPPLAAFQARCRLVSRDSSRELPLERFLTGPKQTALKSGELLQSVILPRKPGQSRFFKLGLRQSMAIAVVNYTLVYRVAEARFTALTVAAGAVAPTVVYLRAFAGALLSEGEALTTALELVDADIAPVTDIRGSAAYRRQVLKNLLSNDCREILGAR